LCTANAALDDKKRYLCTTNAALDDKKRYFCFLRIIIVV